MSIVEASTQPASAPARSGPGLPRVRRRAASLEKLAASVLQVLARRSGLAVSEIAGAIGVTPREIGRPMTWLLARGRVTKVGERRGTRYSLARAELSPPRPPSKPRVVSRRPPRSKSSRKRARSTSSTKKRR